MKESQTQIIHEATVDCHLVFLTAREIAREMTIDNNICTHKKRITKLMYNTTSFPSHR